MVSSVQGLQSESKRLVSLDILGPNVGFTDALPSGESHSNVVAHTQDHFYQKGVQIA